MHRLQLFRGVVFNGYNNLSRIYSQNNSLEYLAATELVISMSSDHFV